MTKILVAEDDPEIRELIEFKLKSSGFDVYAFPDGEAALAAAESVMPDLVLLDWMMPRMNGLDVCAALRSNPLFHTVPIVLLTAKGQEADVVRGFSVGCDDYIVKPFSPRELVHRIDALLTRTRSSSIEALARRIDG